MEFFSTLSIFFAKNRKRQWWWKNSSWGEKTKRYLADNYDWFIEPNNFETLHIEDVHEKIKKNNYDSLILRGPSITKTKLHMVTYCKTVWNYVHSP